MQKNLLETSNPILICFLNKSSRGTFYCIHTCKLLCFTDQWWQNWKWNVCPRASFDLLIEWHASLSTLPKFHHGSWRLLHIFCWKCFDLLNCNLTYFFMSWEIIEYWLRCFQLYIFHITAHLLFFNYRITIL